jgi:hypothetical protein
MMPSSLRPYSIYDVMITEYGAVGIIRIRREKLKYYSENTCPSAILSSCMT